MKKVLSLIFVIILLLSTATVGYAQENSNVISISNPDMIVSKCSTSTSHANICYITITVHDWKQYSKADIIVTYNAAVLLPIWKEYPAMGSYTKPVEKETSEERGKRIFSVSWEESPQYQNEKDVSFEIMFGAGVGVTGPHNISFEVEAYDYDGNKVETILKTDNEIYPEVISAEDAGVCVLDALERKQAKICEKHGITVNDIQNKIKSDNFRIKDKNGNLLSADDIVPNSAVIEILYNGLIAYSATMCISYDVDCDGKVTSSDARLALRYSAQIEKLSASSRDAADVDGSDGISASDARLILRKAAQLD